MYRSRRFFFHKVFFLSQVGFLSLLTPCLEAKTITVCSTCQYISPKTAIDGAQHGDTIIFDGGIYNVGTLTVSKRLSLVGKKNPIFDGENKGHILDLRADNITIEGITLKNTGVSDLKEFAAIHAESVNHCKIRKNIFYNATYGIYLARSHNCFIEENISHGNAQNEILGGNGIHLWYSDDNTIRQNVLKGHRDGIYFEFSQNLHVEKNVATENIRYGLHFMFCHNSIITENRYFMNATGVALMYSKNLNLTANEFSDSRGPSMQGILLKDITDSTVQKNKIAHNTTGLLADNSSRNKIQQNTFVMNGRALEVFGNAQDNRFENNSFLQNIFDVAVNSKENTNTYEKNYWDKYKGYDLNHDGIGDVSFHPVQIFSFWVSKYPELSILAGSSMIYFLEIIERAFPVLTPTSLRDMRPLMQKPIYTRM